MTLFFQCAGFVVGAITMLTALDGLWWWHGEREWSFPRMALFTAGLVLWHYAWHLRP